jgi:hypothetical protein
MHGTSQDQRCFFVGDPLQMGRPKTRLAASERKRDAGARRSDPRPEILDRGTRQGTESVCRPALASDRLIFFFNPARSDLAIRITPSKPRILGHATAKTSIGSRGGGGLWSFFFIIRCLPPIRSQILITKYCTTP